MVKAKKRAKQEKRPEIRIIKDGPYVVSGALPLGKEIIVVDSEGIPVRWRKGEKYQKQDSYALCRCGQSKSKPYCTGTHAETGFDGTEKASRKRYLAQAEKTIGPTINLTDALPLCSSGRFCDRWKGTWKLVDESDNPKARKVAIQQACDCPSGRLVVWDKKAGKAIEPKFKPSISVVEDPGAGSSGPLWVKGGVQVVACDGTKYEKRNRVTLCRCGQSRNKPFCDGTHLQIRFDDGDKRIKR